MEAHLIVEGDDDVAAFLDGGRVVLQQLVVRVIQVAAEPVILRVRPRLLGWRRRVRILRIRLLTSARRYFSSHLSRRHTRELKAHAIMRHAGTGSGRRRGLVLNLGD